MPRVKMKVKPEIDMLIRTGEREIRVDHKKNDWASINAREAMRCKKNPVLLVEDGTEKTKPAKRGSSE